MNTSRRRARARFAWLLGACAALASGCAEQESSTLADATVTHARSVAPANPGDVSTDPRLAFLLAKQPRDEHYGVDTSNALALLETMLRSGQRDALARARAELGAAGPAGLSMAERMIQEAWADGSKSSLLRNALDVVAYSREPRAGDVAAMATKHPVPELALSALRALKVHAAARHFDAVRDMFSRMPYDLRPEVVLSLPAFDPLRATEQIASWIKGGTLAQPSLDLLRLLAGGRDAASGLLCAESYPNSTPPEQCYYAARAARDGDKQAQELLRGMLIDRDSVLRQQAAMAANAAGLCEFVELALREADASGQAEVSTLEGDCRATAREWLRQKSASADEKEASAALEVLVREFKDEDAIDRVIASLRSSRPGALQQAQLILIEPMRRDVRIAERVLQILLEQDRALAGNPFWDRAPLLAAIASVPLEAAANYLAGMWNAPGAAQDGISVRHWMDMRIGNTGVPGQRLLWEALEKEKDPLRRIDLLEAFASQGGELARSRLLEFVLSDAAGPYEVLYAADRLVRLGPTERVAPVLKRATLRVTQPDVRVALQGLLWLNYPGPKADG